MVAVRDPSEHAMHRNTSLSKIASTPRSSSISRANANVTPATTPRRSSEQNVSAHASRTPRGRSETSLPPLTPRANSNQPATHDPNGKPQRGRAPDSHAVPSTPRRSQSAAPARPLPPTPRQASSVTPRRPESAGSRPASATTRSASQGPPPVPTRKAPSGCAQRPEKVTPKPPTPLRVTWLRDGDAAIVRVQMRAAFAAEDDDEDDPVINVTSTNDTKDPPSILVLDLCNLNADEFFNQFCLQYRTIDPAVLEEDTQVDWEELKVTPVELHSKPCLAAHLPVIGPAVVQLRMAQRQLPNGLAAWSDWARNARKESELWLSRTLPPVLVGLQRPDAPNARIDVGVDGVSLGMRLRWMLPLPRRSALGDRIVWQYAWRQAGDVSNDEAILGITPVATASDDDFAKHEAPALGEASPIYFLPGSSGFDLQSCSTAWTVSPEFHDNVTANGEIESSFIRGLEDGLVVVCCVRYRSDQCITWSTWSSPSTPLDVKLAPPQPARETDSPLRAIPRTVDPTTIDLHWEPFVSSHPKVCALQYRIEVLGVPNFCGLVPIADSEEPLRTPTYCSEELADVARMTPEEVRVGDQSSGKSWVHICTMEQRVQTQAWTASGPTKLWCRVRGLQASGLYQARLLVRHWRIDGEFTASAVCEFSTLESKAEHGVQPLRPMPDKCLPNKYKEQNAHWFAFWLPSSVAEWPMEALNFEWRLDAHRATNEDEPQITENDGLKEHLWTFAVAERAALRDVDTDGPFRYGHAMCVQLPVETESDELLVRCRHSAGMVTPMVRFVPRFDPPGPPAARLIIDDSGVSLALNTQASGRGCMQAVCCQFSVCSDKESVDVESSHWHEFPTVALASVTRSSTATLNLRTEDFPGCICPRRRHSFRARIGDDLRWSPWSDISSPVVVSVPPPRPMEAAVLSVCELPGGTAIEVRWPPFTSALGDMQLDYHVYARNVSCPDDIVRQFLPAGLAALADGCRAILRCLVPETEYMLSVHASYPKLETYCEDIDPVARHLELIYTTPTIDTPLHEPPAPPAQVIAPLAQGGVDKRVPWSWDFWLAVDRRALRNSFDAPSSLYGLQWRCIDPHRCADVDGEREVPSDSWVTSTVEIVDSQDVSLPDNSKLCRWDLAKQMGLWQPEACDQIRAPPERVELRIRMESEASRLAVTPWSWHSRTSVPLVTAFASPPKPRVQLQVSPGSLELAVVFMLSCKPPGEEATIPQWLRSADLHVEGNHAVPAGLPTIPETYGHRFVTHFQVRHRQAGDQHAEHCRELTASRLHPEALQCANTIDESLPFGWKCATTSICVQSGAFAHGERHIFSVRVGDGWRWSAWSAFSKPVVFQVPPIQVAPSVPFKDVTLEASFKPPDEVVLRWPSLSTALLVPIQCAVRVHALSPNGHDAKDGQQLVALFTQEVDDKCASETSHSMSIASPPNWQRQIVSKIGQLQHGRSYTFSLMARSLSTILGPAEFHEIARTEPTTFHASGVEQKSPKVMYESWDLPIPSPVPVPDEVESTSGRWRGRALLLAWPKGYAVSDDPPIELQACGAEKESTQEWTPVPWSILRLKERPFILAAPLPFTRGRLRWYSRDRRIAGPRSEMCVAAFEPPLEARVNVFCTMFSARIHVKVVLDEGNHRDATYVQVRCQRARHDSDRENSDAAISEDWLVLSCFSISADRGGPSAEPWVVDLSFGEDDGLKLDRCYVFSARVGGHHRRSAWSVASTPLIYKPPCPVAPSQGEETMLIEALSEDSVRFLWRELRAAEALSPLSLESVGRPQLEYRLDVSRCLPNGGLERQATVLLEDSSDGVAPFEATVHNLLPRARYFATLAVRFARIGRRQWHRTGLKASFESPA